jgi:hypothetical protein
VWLLDGILQGPADRELAESCRKLRREQKFVFGDDLYIPH